MLAISDKDWFLYGCPNCGCDTSIGGNVIFGGTQFATCENCKLEYMILANGVDKSSIGISTKNGTETEYPVLIEHPRRYFPKWKYEWPDVKPTNTYDDTSEYFAPRGVGYDLAGFVRSKQAGERIIELVKKVLNTDNVATWLDYRPHEPKWIQVKFQKEEFNLEKLYNLTKDAGIITEKIIDICKNDNVIENKIS